MVDIELAERVGMLLGLSLFREALTEVCCRPSWDSDPESLWQFGLIIQHFAPHSKDRRYAFTIARGLYRIAETRTQDPLLRAEILADIGMSYFEEGRVANAVVALEASRSLAPWRHRAHFGLLSIACAMQDAVAVQLRCRELSKDIEVWHRDRQLVALLATDPRLAFLRETPEFFLDCLGLALEDVRALHDEHCLEALERALICFDDDEYSRPPTLLRFESVEPLLRVHVATLPGIALDSLQDRLGF